MPIKEFLADDDWHWLKSAVQANKLEVTSAGLWPTPQESSAQIALTPQGRVKLLSRERETPSDRGVVQFDFFCQGAAQQNLSPSTTPFRG